VAHKLKINPTAADVTGGINAPLVVTNGGALMTDRYGMCSSRVVWWYYGLNPEKKVSMTYKHPVWDWLDIDKRTITRAEDGHWDIVADFFGVDPREEPDPLYALDINTSQEPIDTHPEFYNLFAGKPPTGGGAGKNGSFFDEDGLFVDFKPTYKGDLVTNQDWVGVKAYLFASAVWRETKITKTRPTDTDLDGVGYIADGSNTPKIKQKGKGEVTVPTPADRNWLLGNLAYEQKGKTYTVRKEYLLSGKLKWNTGIYKKPPVMPPENTAPTTGI